MKQATLVTLLITTNLFAFSRTIPVKDNNHKTVYTDTTLSRILSLSHIVSMEDMVSDIMNTTGLQADFEVKKAKVLNIEASISHRKRYILYNPEFIDWINNSAAHEMRPHDIRQILREVRILRRSQPFRQHFAACLVFDFRHIATEEFRRHGLATDGMLHFAFALVENNVFPRIFAGLAPNLREKRGEAVIIVLAPAIVRMVVAARTLNSRSEK